MPLHLPKWLLLGLAALVLIGVSVAGTLLVVNQSTAKDGVAAPAPQGAAAPPVDARTKCERQAGALLVGLEKLEIDLAVGLPYAEYVERVDQLRAAYERVPVAELDIGCLKVASPAEKAFEIHVEAAEAWTRCVGDRGCEKAAITPKLRRSWDEATSRLRESGLALAALR